MKSFTLLFAVWHLLTACIPDSEWREVLKMAKLIEHYQHHQTAHHGHLDFVDFLSLHYNDDKHHNEDHDKHENLPFQQHESSVATHVLFCAPAAITWQFSPILLDSKLTVFSYSAHFSGSPFFDFWQPPQG